MQPVLELPGTQGIAEALTSPHKSSSPSGKAKISSRKRKDNDGNPEWTEGLRQLYNSVVEEPLPVNFTELLAKLDQDT